MDDSSLAGEVWGAGWKGALGVRAESVFGVLMPVVARGEESPLEGWRWWLKLSGRVWDGWKGRKGSTELVDLSLKMLAALLVPGVRPSNMFFQSHSHCLCTAMIYHVLVSGMSINTSSGSYACHLSVQYPRALLFGVNAL